MGLVFLTDQYREEQAEEEKERSEIHGAALQDVRRAGSEYLIRHTATERGAEAFLFRALHEDDQSHQQADDHEDHEQEIDANVEPVDRSESHGRGTMGGRFRLVKRGVFGNFTPGNPMKSASRGYWWSNGWPRPKRSGTFSAA